MPFQSEAQRRYLWAKHPDIARKWSHKYGAMAKKELKTRAKKKEETDESKS